MSLGSWNMNEICVSGGERCIVGGSTLLGPGNSDDLGQLALQVLDEAESRLVLGSFAEALLINVLLFNRVELMVCLREHTIVKARNRMGGKPLPKERFKHILGRKTRRALFIFQ